MLSGAKACRSSRSRQELSTSPFFSISFRTRQLFKRVFTIQYLLKILAKVGVDTAENESLKVSQELAKSQKKCLNCWKKYRRARAARDAGVLGCARAGRRGLECAVPVGHAAGRRRQRPPTNSGPAPPEDERALAARRFSRRFPGSFSAVAKRNFASNDALEQRWKALAEIYTMHSFAPFSWDPCAFSNLIFCFQKPLKCLPMFTKCY